MPSLPPIDRAGFPILERRIGKGEGRPLVYLDSAATALVPERVVRAVERFYATSCANIHRGAHALARFAHRAGRQTDDIQPGQAAGEQTLDRYQITVDAAQPGGENARNHTLSLLKIPILTL